MIAIAGRRPLIALDADVVIYSVADHELGRRIRPFIEGHASDLCGSTMLLPETLMKPASRTEEAALAGLLAKVELRPATHAICTLAVALGAKYRLATVDAVHLATAVDADADVFLTNNSKDFDRDRIEEIEVLYPDDLPS